jgi:hypothetical protein
MLLSHILLKDEKYRELCRFIFEFRNSLIRTEFQLVIQGPEFHKYATGGAFPKMCLNCEQIKEVCNGNAPCPKTTEFKQFIKDAAKKFLPKNFTFDSI